MLSLIKCTEKNYTVLTDTKICTEEIQVSEKDNNQTLYMQHGSRLVQKFYQKVACELPGLGNVIKVTKGDGSSVHITQEEKVREFPEVNGFLEDEPLIIAAPVELDIQLEYESFNESGLYDPTYVEAKYNYIFRGEQYATMERGVTTSFVSFENWKDAANGDLNFLAYIEENELIYWLFGGLFWRSIIEFLKVLGYLSGLKLLGTIIKKLVRKLLHEGNERQTLKIIRLGKQNTNRRESLKIENETHSWNDVIINYEEGPPPYGLSD